jgi:hypothetical protein
MDRGDAPRGRHASRRGRSRRTLRDCHCPRTDRRAVPRFRLPLQSFEVGSHIRGTLIAQVAIFLQRLVNDPFEFGGQVRVQAHSGRALSVQNCFEDHSRAFAPERHCTLCHLYSTVPKENKSLRASSSFAGGLLRRHIGDGAKCGAGTGEMLIVDVAGHAICQYTLRSSCGRHFGQPEIKNLGLSSLGYEFVRRRRPRPTTTAEWTSVCRVAKGSKFVFPRHVSLRSVSLQPITGTISGTPHFSGERNGDNGMVHRLAAPTAT